MENNSVCRSIQLLSYFNETQSQNCRMCDVCLQKKQVFTSSVNDILLLIQKHKSLTVAEISSLLNDTEANILILLRQLLAEEKIQTKNNKYFLE
ncbi:RecQ family zinc-binding domain-containing protein [Tenacibaculum tangerinum]|uniref:RecQ family zinc-binding domain-containing protein n=1 Tax=Tenacibaculum tangerinum TaxID=3038772 RepID=A0ABY8LAK0_9FLAO|nr:RecQ family zinc-binding domain-containing protein [Tenacibaculum tangerinum]WGH77060.1 RecQ family zinc-binding domain-containing protein [Tenacibaculum tangerinum]